MTTKEIPTLATDPETGITYDVTDPAHPRELTPREVEEEARATLPSHEIGAPPLPPPKPTYEIGAPPLPPPAEEPEPEVVTGKFIEPTPEEQRAFHRVTGELAPLQRFVPDPEGERYVMPAGVSRVHLEQEQTFWTDLPEYEKQVTEFEETLKDAPEELQEAYRKGGMEAYSQVAYQYMADFESKHIQLPDDKWVPIKQWNELPPSAQAIGMSKGYDAMSEAMQEAEGALAPFKEKDGYRIDKALLTRAPNVERAVDLLFDPEQVREIRYKKLPGLTIGRVAPPPEPKPSALPAGLATVLPAMATVAVAEPTPFGEAVVAIAVLGALAYYTLRGQEIRWPDVWESVVGDVRVQIGRDLTPSETAQLQATTVSAMETLNIPVTGIPPFAPPKIEIPMEQIIPTLVEKRIPAFTPPVIERPMEQIIPPKVEKGIPPLTPPTVDLPKILVAQVAVAVAERELAGIWVIIRPKIIEPGKYVPAVIPKTETALVALDEAVREAYTKGEISEKELQVYQTARQNYLTKKQILDIAKQTYIGGATPEVSSVDYLAGLASLAVLSDLQTVAQQVADRVYTEAINKNLTQAQARAQAESAVQSAVATRITTAIQTAVQTATRTVTQPAVRTAVRTATRTAVRAATRPLARTAVNTAIATMAMALRPVPPPLPPIPPLIIPRGEARLLATGKPVPAGSIAFAFGKRKGIRGILVPQWYYIPPPYDMNKPASLSAPPLGATNADSVNPYETIQVVGRSRRYKVPASISIDIGVTDAFITDYGQRITFAGKGVLTDVGTRLSETTKGMSVSEYGGNGGLPVVRKAKPRRRAKRRDDFSDITSLRGIRY